ncbi:phage protein NinX family protein [Pectobacterium versatile]|uniref:phage protein NinX family protein n=1 Tax=Pectobacterium versatile TaxID=2488639 RepID=UPI00301AD590
MKVKTSELSGAALNWAVANATRKEMPSVAQWILWDDYHPTTNWRHCGPLIEKYKVGLGMEFIESGWFAAIDDEEGIRGDTPQIAICRAVVASVIGDEIELPEGLQ